MPRRRTNGEGTIYQRKDGRWEGSLYVFTASGLRKRVSVYGKTRAAAYEKLVRIKSTQLNGIPFADKTWRLAEYLDYWLENIIKPNRRPTTYESYEHKIRRYLKPDLGNHVLARLSVTTVQSYLNHQLASGQSERVIQVVREVLSSALTSAMRHELVSRNVARLVQLPGRSGSRGAPWTLAEATHFLKKTAGHWLYPAFVLLLIYGLRRGEVIGLRWEDVDFTRDELHIEQQVYRANGVVAEGPLKTTSSRRVLPLVGLARRALLAHQAAPGGTASHLVFTAQKSNGPVAPQSFTRAFQRATKSVGLRPARAHDMRHTTATLLKNLGVPARDVQLILGHSNIQTTQQIYQHDDLSTRRAALTRLETQFCSDGNVEDLPEGSGLPSAPPSNLVLAIDRQREKAPRWHLVLYKFLGWGGGIRTPECMDQKREPVTFSARADHITEEARRWRLTRMTGVAAVKLAVTCHAAGSQELLVSG